MSKNVSSKRVRPDEPKGSPTDASADPLTNTVAVDGRIVSTGPKDSSDIARSTLANTIATYQKIDDKQAAAITKAHQRIDETRSAMSKLNGRLEKLEGKITKCTGDVWDIRHMMNDAHEALLPYCDDIHVGARYDELLLLCLQRAS